ELRWSHGTSFHDIHLNSSMGQPAEITRCREAILMAPAAAAYCSRARARLQVDDSSIPTIPGFLLLPFDAQNRGKRHGGGFHTQHLTTEGDGGCLPLKE